MGVIMVTVTGQKISLTPSVAAFKEESPCSFFAAIFSAITIASSTSSPKTKTSETSVTVFRGIPNALNKINEPRKERGIPIAAQNATYGGRKK